MARTIILFISIAFVGSLDFVRGQSSSIELAEPNIIGVGPGERALFGPPSIEPPLSAADKALQNTMQLDPTTASKRSDDHRQMRAIEAWKLLLDREDLKSEQKVFAWWRIGSLAAYNFDPRKGEVSDIQLAERALKKVHELADDRISIETLNTATVFGSLEGKPGIRAARLAMSYRWLFTRTDAMVKESARLINSNGRMIDERLTLGGMRLDSVSKKYDFLRSSLAEHQRIITRRIIEEINFSEDPEAVSEMLKSIGDLADTIVRQRWNTALEEVRMRAEKKSRLGIK